MEKKSIKFLVFSLCLVILLNQKRIESLDVRQSVQIFNIRENRSTNAAIVEIGDKHIQDFEDIWIAELAELGEEDKYWDRAFKKRLALNEDSFESYALECKGTTQGLHSLPNAIEFYRKRKMIELGSDPDCDDLIYFEFGSVRTR